MKRASSSAAYDIGRSTDVDPWRIGLLNFNLKCIDGDLELEKATQME